MRFGVAGGEAHREAVFFGQPLNVCLILVKPDFGVARHGERGVELSGDVKALVHLRAGHRLAGRGVHDLQTESC